MKQQEFKLLREFQSRREHGGEGTFGKRKVHRPFDSRQAIHIVLRSKKAQGALNMARSKFEPKVSKLVYGLGVRFRINVHEFSNSGNHLHLLVQAQSKCARIAKRDFQNFLRTLTALVARLITGAKKGRRAFAGGAYRKNAQQGFGYQSRNKGTPKRKFWDALAYTRLVSLGREFARVARYILLNRLETWGIVPANQRKKLQTLNYEELLSLVPFKELPQDIPDPPSLAW